MTDEDLGDPLTRAAIEADAVREQDSADLAAVQGPPAKPIHGTELGALFEGAVGSLSGEPRLAAQLQVGDAASRTLEAQGVPSAVPPHVHLLAALGIIAVVAGAKRMAAARAAAQQQQAPPFGVPR